MVVTIERVVDSRIQESGQRRGRPQLKSLKSALVITIQRIKKILAYFEVPSTSVEPIRVKLVMTIFDEHTNILKGMYSIRFNGRSDHGGTSVRPENGSSDGF